MDDWIKGGPLPICTMSFDVNQPIEYEGLDKDPSYVEAFKQFCDDYKIQVLSRQRVCNSKRYNLLIAFDDLNLFAEMLIAFREHDVLWKPEVMGNTTPKFHIIDPDYQQYEKNVAELIDLLEKSLTTLCDLKQTSPKVIKAIENSFEQKGMEKLKPLLEARFRKTSQTIDHVHTALHMLRSSGDENQILN